MLQPGQNDNSGLRLLFTKPNFDVDRFVKNTLRNSDQSAQTMVARLSEMSEEASSKMKKAIFENYKLFIKAGKTATVLEGTMHQIHSEFAEKQQIISALVNHSLFNETLPEITPLASESSKTNVRDSGHLGSENADVGTPVSSIFDTIQGSAQILCDDLSRRVIYSADVLELSVDTYAPIWSAHLVLLNDLLIVAFEQRRPDEPKFRIQASYSLENVEVITTVPKDRRHFPPAAFKLTMSNITRMFKADNQEAKQLLTQLIDDTKRSFSLAQIAKRKSLVLEAAQSPTAPVVESPAVLPNPPMPSLAVPLNRASDEAVRDVYKALSSTLPECTDLLSALREPTIGESAPGRKNPFGTSYDDSQVPSSDEFEKESLDWLWGFPEDLDVAISERNFNQATELVVKARRLINKLTTTYTATPSSNTRNVDLTTVAARIDQDEAKLTETLQHELITATDRHGAPQAVGSVILNLGMLGKATLAAQLYLLYRSNLLVRSLTRGTRQEGNQLVYLNRLSFAFHRNLAQTTIEWQKVVVKPLLDQCRNQGGDGQTPKSDREVKALERLLSLRFCSWVLEQAQDFGDQLRALLVDSRSISFATLAMASQRITAHAEKLTTLLGVDILSAIQARLIPTWKKAAETQSQLIKDTVDAHAREESWNPISSAQAQEQEKDLIELGLLKRPPGSYLLLTAGSFYLFRSLYYFVQNCDRINCEELEPTVNHYVSSILQSELRNYEQALNNPQLSEKKPIILFNLSVLVQRVIPRLIRNVNGWHYPETREVISALKTLSDQTASPTRAD